MAFIPTNTLRKKSDEARRILDKGRSAYTNTKRIYRDIASGKKDFRDVLRETGANVREYQEVIKETKDFMKLPRTQTMPKLSTGKGNSTKTTTTGKNPGVTLTFIPPSVSGAVTNSYFRKGIKLKKYLKDATKTATTQIYSSTVGESWTTGATGTQLVYSVSSWVQSSVKVNAFNTICNGALSTSAGIPIVNSVDYNKKVLIKKFWESFMITNYDISTCFLEIYVVRPRQANVLTPGAIWKAAMPATPGSGSGVGSDDTSEAAPNAWSVPGASPWACRTLLEEYKIIKRYKVELQQGCTHKFTITNLVNRAFTGREMVDLGGTFENFIYIPLFIVCGTPIHQQNATTTVSTSKIKCDVVRTFGASGCQIGSTTSSQIIKTNLLTNISLEEAFSVGSGALGSD